MRAHLHTLPPALSPCDHAFDIGTYSTYFGYLLRLYLVTGTAELLPDQQQAVDLRVRDLWNRVRLEGASDGGGPAVAQTEQNLAVVLGCSHCRETVRRRVSLFNALGPAAVSWVL